MLLLRRQLAEAQLLAQRLTLGIAATGSPRVTVSIGVAEAHARLESVEQVIQRAEATLYRAKEAGRNRMVVAADIVPAWLVGTRSEADAPQAP